MHLEKRGDDDDKDDRDGDDEYVMMMLRIVSRLTYDAIKMELSGLLFHLIASSLLSCR